MSTINLGEKKKKRGKRNKILVSVITKIGMSK